VRAGTHFFLTTAMQGTTSCFEPLTGNFFVFGFCRPPTPSFRYEENQAEIQQEYEGCLTNISCTLQGFAHLTGRGMKILVSNGHTCVIKLSIHLALSSKTELCLNSSHQCGERLTYTGKKATSVFLCN